jgi:hypothetical protein
MSFGVNTLGDKFPLSLGVGSLDFFAACVEVDGVRELVSYATAYCDLSEKIGTVT